MILSLAIAWNNFGAPAKHCNPAPIDENNAPTSTIHSFGQAILAIAKPPPIDCPNLELHSTMSVSHANLLCLNLLVSQY